MFDDLGLSDAGTMSAAIWIGASAGGE